METPTIQEDIVPHMETNKGQNVKELSFRQPVLLLFMRHFGCTFCRQALSDISKQRNEIEKKGVLPLVVHLNDDEVTLKHLQKYGIDDMERVRDEAMRFYADFGLIKGNFKQLFGLKNWIRGFESGILNGHGLPRPIGDSLQMPGVFLLHEGRIVKKFVHQYASDRPDYIDLSTLPEN